MAKILALLLFILLISCNQKKTTPQDITKGTFSTDTISGERLYTTDLEDIEMNNAITKANAQLSTFDKALKSGNKDFEFFNLKKRFNTPDGGGEHIWITDVELYKDGYKGIVDNEPVNTNEIQLGDTVIVSKSDITDWTYLKNNVLQGGYTLRVELKRMSAEEKKEFLQSLDYKIEE